MDKSSFSKNAIYNVVYKMLNVLFPLLSIAIISRILLPTGVGKISSAQNIVTYFTFLAPLGLSFYGTREISKASSENINQLFSECFIINAISTSICIAIYYGMVVSLSYFSGEFKLYLVSGSAIVLNFFNVDWFYQGKEEYKYIALRSSIVKLLMLFCIIVFIKTEHDYIKYTLITCLATAGNYIFNIWHLKKYGVRVVLRGINLSKHLKHLFILLASNIAVELYSLVDTTMLTVMCPPEVVGYYANAMKLTKVAVFVITAIGGVALPHIAPFVQVGQRNKVEEIVDYIVKCMLFIAVPAGLGMMTVADKLVYVLFGESFNGAIPTVRILSILFYVLTFSNFFGTQVLVAYYREKEVLLAAVCGAVTNIILNCFLIRIFAQNGAAVASVASEVVVAVITLLFVRREIEIRISVRYFYSILVSGLMMVLLTFIVKNFIGSDFVSLIVSIIIAVVSYFAINVLLKNEMANMVIEMVKTNIDRRK